jgi:hypothetical protein
MRILTLQRHNWLTWKKERGLLRSCNDLPVIDSEKFSDLLLCIFTQFATC